jgi:hypothetical protein
MKEGRGNRKLVEKNLQVVVLRLNNSFEIQCRGPVQMKLV